MDKEYFASINEVSRELGLPAYTLRYWEKQFPTVVRPVTGAGGRRYYRPEVVARLRTIQDLLYNRGMTIHGVKKLIHNGEFLSDVDDVPVPVVEDESTGQEYLDIESLQEPMLNIEDIVPVASRQSAPAQLDVAKVDLAIGLLHQARELLQ